MSLLLPNRSQSILRRDPRIHLFCCVSCLQLTPSDARGARHHRVKNLHFMSSLKMTSQTSGKPSDYRHAEKKTKKRKKHRDPQLKNPWHHSSISRALLCQSYAFSTPTTICPKRVLYFLAAFSCSARYSSSLASRISYSSSVMKPSSVSSSSRASSTKSSNSSASSSTSGAATGASW
jgi:hypothetical protein